MNINIIINLGQVKLQTKLTFQSDLGGIVCFIVHAEVQQFFSCVCHYFRTLAMYFICEPPNAQNPAILVNRSF